MKIDYVVVGAGLTGCVLAEQLSKRGRVLIVEERNHIGGNCYDYYDEHGILLHKYGPHFFHTGHKIVWDYLSQFTEWHYYQHRVLSYIDGRLMVVPPTTAECSSSLYEKMFIEYSKKQWGKYWDKLDKKVLARVPLRVEKDDRYFLDKYQAMPKRGFTHMIGNIIDNPAIKVLLNTNYLGEKIEYSKALVYTGKIDRYYGWTSAIQPMTYKSLRFETEHFHQEFYQPVAQVNYPMDYDFTRIVEIKHATGQKCEGTTIVREYPLEDVNSGEPFYPIPCEENRLRYKQFVELAKQEKNVYFVGRLAQYAYYNMDEAVLNALTFAEIIE